MKRILHLSHTDFRVDPRVLKEINSLTLTNKYHISGIGINDTEGNQPADTSSFDYKGLNLFSKRLTFLPKVIRHMLTLAEFSIKTLYFTKNKQFDLIHCHDTIVLPIGVFLSFIKKSKVIYDAHELESNKNGLSKLLGKATLFIEKLLWKSIDALITVSPSIQSWYMTELGVKKSEVILNSPVYAPQESKSTYLREHFNIKNSHPIFIYVGILGKGRGIEMISDAFTIGKLKSNLVFLGFGAFYDELQTLAQQHENVYVHPAVTHDEVVSVISSADYGLCLIENISLSDYYCLPNKLFEYSFAGLKILASNFPDLAATVKEYNLGVCCDIDEDSIINAIQQIESNEIIFEGSSKNLKELSWEAQSQKLLNLYHDLLY